MTKRIIKAPFFFLFLAQLALFACQSQKESYFIQTAPVPEGATLDQKVELSAYVLPHPRQMKWFEDEFFGFIHYGPNTYTGREWGTGFEDATLFVPGNLDTDQWCEVMKDAGIRRVVMVVKHHEGYCLWQTRYTNYSVASSPWLDGQGDVLRELAQSCEKYGLRLGIYLSPADLYQIEAPGGLYGNGSEFTQRNIPRPVEGRPFDDKRTFTYEADDYNEYFLNQLFELLTEYGPVYELWFDGAHPKPGTNQVYNYDAWFDLIRNLAPDAVIFGKGPDSRWCGNEGGATREAEYNVIPLTQSPDTYDWPDKMGENIAGRDKINEETSYFHYYPAETNTSIRHGWFWRNDDEQQVRSADDVFDIYERSVGGNSVFHLNIPPNKDGQFSRRDVEVLREVGRRIREVYGNDLLAGGSSKERKVLDNNRDTWWQAPGTTAELVVKLPQLTSVNRVVIQEAIAHRGERVEVHHLEALIDGKWVKVAEGKTIGYKRILRFPAVDTDQLKLVITQSRVAPSISQFSVHYYDEPPKPVVIRHDIKGNVTMGVGTGFSWKDHGAIDLSQNIYYTLDGSEPTIQSLRYSETISLTGGAHIRARAIVGDRSGSITELRLGIAKDKWSAVDDRGEDASHAIDGNVRSSWLATTSVTAPISLTIDMIQPHKITGLAYLPAAPRGYIESYTIETSQDGTTWKTIHQGDFGNIRNDPSRRIVLFDKAHNARWVRLSNLKAPGGQMQVGVAEIDIL
jgi:alpha-L-fucosidase